MIRCVTNIKANDKSTIREKYILKMQHQYWITKQTLSRKLGRKEDECIVSSDAQLDAKLELFRNIQMSCTLIQRIINKYQESICSLSQEINSMGRFLKENTNEEKSRTGDVMLTIGKSLIFCAQQQLILHEPLIRFYQELETFRQRAVEDTLQNVSAMEKARTEYRASLSWMKNVSQQLDPDTTKQLEKFKKVQHQVRRGKINFDKQSLDCLQKIDLLAAARCNMFNQALSFYQNKLLNYIQKSAGTYSTISENFEYQNFDQICDKNDFKILSMYDINCKEKKQQFEKKNRLKFSERKTLKVDNIKIQTNIFENFTTMDNLISSELKNQTDRLESVPPSKYKNNLKESSNTEASYDYSTEANDFLPSALLKESLESAINKSKTQNSSIFTENNHVELSKKTNNTKSWINLFEELDPLSNNLNEKHTKHKSSFV